jgi:hypothetical protein
LGATVESLADAFKKADELYRENTKEIRANRESTQEMEEALLVRQKKYKLISPVFSYLSATSYR